MAINCRFQTYFKADLEVRKWVMADTSGELQEYQLRSQFQLLPVEQLALAMEEAGYEMTDKVAGVSGKETPENYLQSDLRGCFPEAEEEETATFEQEVEFA